MIGAVLLFAALSTDAWLADFRQILDEMSSHYANLDSAIRDRRMNLPDLRRRTETAIRNAKSDDEAKQAINTFLREFGDGHVGIDWQPKPAVQANDAPVCDRYKKRDDPNAIDFTQLDSFTPFVDADAADFPGGILTLARDRKVGVVRIQLFSAEIHPALCQAAAAADINEANRLESVVYDSMTAALERRIAQIAKANANALVVDLTANGGGSDWVEAAARVLTSVELKSPRLGFIRHPHWVKQLEEELDDVNVDWHNHPTPPIAHARHTLVDALAEARKPCDRSGVWLDEPKTPQCSLVVSDMLYASGVLPYAKPNSLSSERSNGVLFHPTWFRYHEGANKLPLIVITDGRTASASELFTAMLKDNKAATIIGTPTTGSGCGHTNGGIDASLKNSGARLSLPDCVRFRADGTNEIVGITPDVLIPFRGFDSRYQRAIKVQRALENIVKK